MDSKQEAREEYEKRRLIELTETQNVALERHREIVDYHSAQWNKRTRAMRNRGSEPLPDGWRDLHHKTLIKLASDMTGAEPASKDEAVKALEAFEHGGN